MLIIPIWVNNTEVARAELFRVSPIDCRPADNEMCTYTVRYYDGRPTPVWSGKIEHPYIPNNPLPLTIAVLSKIEAIK